MHRRGVQYLLPVHLAGHVERGHHTRQTDVERGVHVLGLEAVHQLARRLVADTLVLKRLEQEDVAVGAQHRQRPYVAHVARGVRYIIVTRLSGKRGTGGRRQLLVAAAGVEETPRAISGVEGVCV